MEQLVEMGLVRNIGTSNMTIPKLELLLRDAKIKPACNEMELHPHFQQGELFDFVVENGMVPVGFCPIGSPTRPDRDKTPGDTVDIEDPVIVRIAQRLGVQEGDQLTAREFCLLLRDRAGDITDIYRESPAARTAQRQAKLQRGVAKFLE